MSNPFSFKKRAKSFVYAYRGIRMLLAREHNARIHCAATAAAVSAGFYFQITRGEWAVVILCCGLVLAAEAGNTAIERVVDIVSPHYLPAAGAAKDIAAGAVLICAVTAVIAGTLIFAPYLTSLWLH